MAEVQRSEKMQEPHRGMVRMQPSTSQRRMASRRSPVQGYRTDQPSPISLMQRIVGEMDRLFSDMGFSPLLANASELRGAWVPEVDVFERGRQLVMHADLPGLREEDVHVTVDDDVLTLSGERRHEHEHDKDGVYQCERSYGAFRRSFALPDGVDPDSIQANFDNGVLEVTMTLEATPTQGRTIPIGGKSSGISH